MLTLIVKPVGNACTLECGYCYTTDPNLRQRKSCGRMSLDLFERLTRDFFSTEQRGYQFIWHGGEPLLWGLDMFKGALAIQRSLKEKLGVKGLVLNKIQTNGVLINTHWAEFLRKCKFRVGVSLDGPEEIHNAMRVYSSDEGSFEDTMRGIGHLNRAGVQYGLNAVVTSTCINRVAEIFTFFAQRFDTVNFSPCFEATGQAGDTSYRLTADMYKAFVLKLFHLWRAAGKQRPNIPLLRKYIAAAQGQRPKACSWRGTCGNYLGVTGDGSVYPCGRFSGLPELKLGNIQETSIWKMARSQAHQDQLRAMLTLPETCSSCKWGHVCNNGCPAHRYTSEGGFIPNSPLCEATQQILDSLEKLLKT